MNYGKLGFGFLRLPHMDPDNPYDVDLDTTKEMVDMFLQRGFRYFDTAYTYLGGKSEEYLQKALVERYPREAFRIATKMPCGALHSGKTPEEIVTEQGSLFPSAAVVASVGNSKQKSGFPTEAAQHIQYSTGNTEMSILTFSNILPSFLWNIPS